MSMLLTAGGLAAITLFAVRRHLGSRNGDHGQSSAADRRRNCPRCGAAIPAAATICAACGVPQQIYELVSAPVAAEPTSDEREAPPRAMVRADLCVGCGACTAACPEPGAITMQGKLAVVDPQRCKGHGECIAACPLGAISVVRGTAANRVVVPQVDANFETSVPALYIVGELGGRALIKNAVNEGRVAAEHVVKRAAGRRSPNAQEVADVVIVGSGPSGLSAALVAHRAGLNYVLLEQGTLADTVRKYPRHKLLFAEPLTLPMYGDLWVSDSSKESLLAVWETIIEKTGLRVHTGEQVRELSHDGTCFDLVATNDARYRASAVILALGRRGTPRRLNVPGEELSNVFYDVAEMADFAGLRVLVVGGGDSAIETALGLANQSGTTVTLSYRGEEFSRLKDRNRTKIDAAIANGKVTVLLLSRVREIRRDVVLMEVGGSSHILPVDDVIVRIGGEPPNALLQQVGVRMVTKEIVAAPDARAGSGDAA